MKAPVALLDACTLYPAALRDVLMRLAVDKAHPVENIDGCGIIRSPLQQRIAGGLV